MAKKYQEPQQEQQPQSPGKSFGGAQQAFHSLEVGDTVTGLFMNCGYQEIVNTRSAVREMKQVLVMKLREPESDEVLKIACAAMLKSAWEDIVDEYGNGDHDQAVRNLRGKKMTINRGEDTRTKS